MQNDLHTYTWSVNGVRPVYQDIMKLDIDQGRFFNGAEDQQRAHVCVIGSEAKTKLFSGGWAVGEDHPPQRRDVHHRRRACPQDAGGRSDDINRQIYIPFNTMSDLKDTEYLTASGSAITATISWPRRACARPWPPLTTSAPPITTPSTSPT